MLKNIIYKSTCKNACGLEWLWHLFTQPLAGIFNADHRHPQTFLPAPFQAIYRAYDL